MADTPKVVLIPIGGLGGSQLEAINLMAETIPGVKVARMSRSNDYLDAHSDIWHTLNAYREAWFLFVGHSLGGGTARNSANYAILDGRKVFGVMLLDDVEYSFGPHESKCPNTAVYMAENSFPFIPCDIAGFPAVHVPNTNHNTLCQSQTVLDRVKAELLKAVAL